MIKLTVEQIARIFELDIEVVKQAIKQQSNKKTFDE